MGTHSWNAAVHEVHAGLYRDDGTPPSSPVCMRPALTHNSTVALLVTNRGTGTAGRPAAEVWGFPHLSGTPGLKESQSMTSASTGYPGVPGVPQPRVRGDSVISGLLTWRPGCVHHLRLGKLASSWLGQAGT